MGIAKILTLLGAAAATIIIRITIRRRVKKKK